MITKTHFEKLVVKRKKSNFINHFFAAFNHDSPSYNGEILQNEILLWKSTFFMRCNFPVIHLMFYEDRFKEITTTRNQFHKVINILLVVGMMYIITVIFTDNKLTILSSFKMALIYCIFFLIVYLIFRYINKFERKNQIEELRSYIIKLESKN